MPTQAIREVSEHLARIKGNCWDAWNGVVTVDCSRMVMPPAGHVYLKPDEQLKRPEGILRFSPDQIIPFRSALLNDQESISGDEYWKGLGSRYVLTVHVGEFFLREQGRYPRKLFGYRVGLWGSLFHREKMPTQRALHYMIKENEEAPVRLCVKRLSEDFDVRDAVGCIT